MASEREGKSKPDRMGNSNICQQSIATHQRTAMSAPSTSTAAPTQQVNVADLELPQLVEVKRQLEEVCNRFPCSPARILSHHNQELSHLTNSFAQLKQAQAKFRSCIESAKEVKRENKGTSSMYLRVWRALG